MQTKTRWLRIGVALAAAGFLTGCGSVDDLFASNPPDQPVATAIAEAPLASAAPPNTSFCDGAADEAARPPTHPTFYPAEEQRHIRAAFFAECMAHFAR